MKSLTVQESGEMFTLMLTGKMPEADIEHFLLTLRDKGENADEILGAIRAIKKTAPLPLTPNPLALDVCGTGGDGLSTLNISTAVAFVLAGAGVKVAKHGNKAVSSKSGSSDVLAELGIKFENPDLAKHNFAYFHAPIYYPALKTVAAARAKVGRSIFNLLGPLLNPVGAKHQLIGVYSANLLPIYAKVLRELGTKKAWIVCGADGLDEVSISGETQVAELDKGAIDTFIITPEDAGLTRHPLESIKGGDAKHNAAALLRLLNGEKGAYRDIVLLNSAAALMVAEKANNLIEGVKIAETSIDKGQALAVLNKLKEITNE